MKILIMGASGSGTSTLAKELSKRKSFVHLDADKFYWANTLIPFQEKIPLEIRNQKLLDGFNKDVNVVISGSLVSWGEHWKNLFDRPTVRDRLKY